MSKDLKLAVPVPPTSGHAFWSSASAALGITARPTTWVLEEGGKLLAATATHPVQVAVISSGPKRDVPAVVSVPNPMAGVELPTLFVGNVDQRFLAKSPFEQYLQAFRWLSWPEKMILYQVSGTGGRLLLSDTGICDAFSALSPFDFV
jgi:hypothetical protein